MRLSEFLRDHYDHYVYLHKDDGTVITDVMVKFVPYWVLVMYGGCEVHAVCRSHQKDDAYQIYDVSVTVDSGSLSEVKDLKQILEYLCREYGDDEQSRVVYIRDRYGNMYAEIVLWDTLSKTELNNSFGGDDWDYLLTRRVIAYSVGDSEINVSVHMSADA